MDQRWYGFMSTDKWAVFMTIMKILTFILLIMIIFTLVSEIDIVKELDKNHCAICMEKTGCLCACLNLDHLDTLEEEKILILENAK